jgi:hypothetical protein
VPLHLVHDSCDTTVTEQTKSILGGFTVDDDLVMRGLWCPRKAPKRSLCQVKLHRLKLVGLLRVFGLALALSLLWKAVSNEILETVEFDWNSNIGCQI